MFETDSKWPFVINLSNGIIGVSVLTMPFCMEKCGIVLGILLLIASGLLTRLTCNLLISGAFLTHRRSYEQYAFQVFGPLGKTVVEISMILYTKTTLIAFFVVIGDLGTSIFGDLFFDSSPTKIADDESVENFRIFFMIAFAFAVILPLSLLRNLTSLNVISSLAILFYACLVLRLFTASFSNIISDAMWKEVNYWRFGGVLQCLPIFAMSLSCQTQLFVISNELPDPSVSKMDYVVSKAVTFCSTVYFSIGLFGYAAFYDRPINGDVMVMLEGNWLTRLIKLGFLLSVAVSYPIMIFPCRAAIYSLLNSRRIIMPSSSLELQSEMHIPPVPLKVITVFLISFNLLVAVIVPNMELILGLSGSLIGSVICFIIPALLYINSNANLNRKDVYANLIARVCLIVGMFMLIFCTYATLIEHYGSTNELDHQPVLSKDPVAPERLDVVKRAVAKDSAAAGYLTPSRIIKTNLTNYSET